MGTFSLHNWRHFDIEQGCAWNVSLASGNSDTGKLLGNISRERTKTRDQFKRVSRHIYEKFT